MHPIGCCLPELHSNEPGRWEAASTHESSLLNPSSASPQPSLTSTDTAPALQLIAILIPLPPPEVNQGETAKAGRTTVKRTTGSMQSSHTRLFQEKQDRTIPYSTSVHSSAFPRRVRGQYCRNKDGVEGMGYDVQLCSCLTQVREMLTPKGINSPQKQRCTASVLLVDVSLC